MSTVFEIFVSALALIAEFAWSRQMIKSYSSVVEWDKRHYQLAQIIPPGKYKVIIWDKLLKAELSNSAIFDHLQSIPSRKELVFAFDQKNFADYDKYFMHFYQTETDEQGQFLMRKNAKIGKWSLSKCFFHFTLTPMKGANLIPPDGTGMFIWQKIYVRKVSDALDSVCRFIDRRNQCLINYFETIYDWKRFTRLALNTFWLAGSRFFGALPDWLNFFLVASFRHLINEAKRKKELESEMALGDAKILGIFWDAFATAHKHGILLQRIRMADDQMLGLINEFCQIDRSFLMGHNELMVQTNRENDFGSFCPKWGEMSKSLALFTQNDTTMRAFSGWVHSNEPISEQSQGIIQFWLKMFSIWLTKERDEESTPWLAGPWLPFDLTLFRQIGELFAKGSAAKAFTPQKMERIGGIREALSTICVGTKGAQYEFLRGNGQKSIAILNQWRRFCASCAPLASKHQNDHSADESAAADSANRCVICLSNERQIAFIPCRHLCVCEHCAKTVERNEQPKCPVCRSCVEGTIRIYIP